MFFDQNSVVPEMNIDAFTLQAFAQSETEVNFSWLDPDHDIDFVTMILYLFKCLSYSSNGNKKVFDIPVRSW